MAPVSGASIDISWVGPFGCGCVSHHLWKVSCLRTLLEHHGARDLAGSRVSLPSPASTVCVVIVCKTEGTEAMLCLLRSGREPISPKLTYMLFENF